MSDASKLLLEDTGVQDIVSLCNRAVGLSERDSRTQGIMNELLEKAEKQAGRNPWTAYAVTGGLTLFSFGAAAVISILKEPAAQLLTALLSLLRAPRFFRFSGPALAATCLKLARGC